MYFLLSDMIVMARPQNDQTPMPLFFKGKIDLAGASIKEFVKKKNGPANCFELWVDATDPSYRYADDINALLAAAGGATQQQYVLKADSKEAQAMWMQELQTVISQLQRVQANQQR